MPLSRLHVHYGRGLKCILYVLTTMSENHVTTKPLAQSLFIIVGLCKEAAFFLLFLRESRDSIGSTQILHSAEAVLPSTTLYLWSNSKFIFYADQIRFGRTFLASPSDGGVCFSRYQKPYFTPFETPSVLSRAYDFLDGHIASCKALI